MTTLYSHFAELQPLSKVLGNLCIYLYNFMYNILEMSYMYINFGSMSCGKILYIKYFTKTCLKDARNR